MDDYSDDQLIEEQWKDIPGFTGYEASTLGRVRNKGNGYVKKPNICNGGYARIVILGKSNYIHRLIALTFIPNPENKRTVNHINKIRDDNRLINLEWATHKEQNKGRIGKRGGRTTPIVQYDLQDNFIQEFESIYFASKYLNVNKNFESTSNKISKVIKNKTYEAYGFLWKEKVEFFFGDEIWELIPSTDNRYYISNYGRIKNLRNQILKLPLNNSGYISIVLNKKTYLGHRLVATIFIPNPENKPFVNHLDGNKVNNHVDNLEWCTSSENNFHTVTLGSNKNVKKIISFNKEGHIIKIYDHMKDIADTLKIFDRSLTQCLKHKRYIDDKGRLFYFKYLTPLDDVISNKIEPNFNIDELKALNEDPDGIKVNVYDKDWNYITTYDSITVTAKTLKVSRGTVLSHCRNMPLVTKGKYKFKFAE